MKKRLQVYEFGDDDKLVEADSMNLLKKFGKSRKNHQQSSPIDKYKFLECFSQGTKRQQKENRNEPIGIDAEVAQVAKPQPMEINNEPIDVVVRVTCGRKPQRKKISTKPIDVDAEVAQVDESQQIEINIETMDVVAGVARGTKPQLKEIRNEPIDVDAGVAQDAKPQQMKINNEPIDVAAGDSVYYSMGISREDDASREVAKLEALLLSNSSNYENDQVDVISDDDDCIEMSPSSTSFFTVSEREVLLEEQVAEHGSSIHEIDIANVPVVIFPDFILFGDIYGTECRLTFTSSCVKVECSTINGTMETFNFEWAIGDITKIESEWCSSVETASVILERKADDPRGAGNANKISDIKLLKVSVHDPCWPKVQEVIKSLDVRYKDIWGVVFDTDRENEENAFSTGGRSNLLSRQYLFDFDEPFEDVIYPKDDPDAVLISKRDVDLLRPETFINDTIIDFYLKYLKNKIQPEKQYRFHFFNCFFFRKLADLDKGPSSACDGKEAFQRVRKWTRKVNLFEKDYVFIPVNYSLHWSLIVICHPGEVAHFKDDEIEKSPKVPCILHMDSIKGSHRGLQNLLQSYLCEEWKQRHGNTDDEVPSKFSCLRFVTLELPQQENSSDCGLFLLHYAERFVEEAPVTFSPFKITELSNFLTRNWFPPLEASLKRARIKKLIYEILEDSQKDSSADCIDECPSPQFLPDKDEQEPGFVYREKFVAEIGSGSLPSKSYQQITACHQRNIMTPIQEVEETGTSSSDVEYCRLVSKSPTTSYTTRDFRVMEKRHWDQQISSHLEEQGESISSHTSQDGLDEDGPHAEYLASNNPGTNDKAESSSTSSEQFDACVVEDSQEEDELAAITIEDSEEANEVAESSSTSSEEFDACVVEESQEEDELAAITIEDSEEANELGGFTVEDSEEANTMQEGNEKNKDSQFPFKETHKESDLTENINLEGIKMPIIIEEDPMEEADEQKGSKKWLPKGRKQLT